MSTALDQAPATAPVQPPPSPKPSGLFSKIMALDATRHQPPEPPKDRTAIVEFYGHKLLTVRKDGVEYAALKPICDALGLNWKTQFRKVVSDTGYGHMTIPFASNGGIQEMLCLPLRKLAGWLFGISPSKVAPELKDKLIRFRDECFEALHDYWTKGYAARFNVNPPERVAQFSADMQNRLYYNAEPVLPEDWLAWYLNLSGGTIGYQLLEHDWAFEQGKHYYRVNSSEMQQLNRQVDGIAWLKPLDGTCSYLFTREGVKMLCALMTRRHLDDAYRHLCDTYFAESAKLFTTPQESFSAALDKARLLMIQIEHVSRSMTQFSMLTSPTPLPAD